MSLLHGLAARAAGLAVPGAAQAHASSQRLGRRGESHDPVAPIDEYTETSSGRETPLEPGTDAAEEHAAPETVASPTHPADRRAAIAKAPRGDARLEPGATPVEAHADERTSERTPVEPVERGPRPQGSPSTAARPIETPKPPLTQRGSTPTPASVRPADPEPRAGKTAKPSRQALELEEESAPARTADHAQGQATSARRPSRPGVGQLATPIADKPLPGPSTEPDVPTAAAEPESSATRRAAPAAPSARGVVEPRAGANSPARDTILEPEREPVDPPRERAAQDAGRSRAREAATKPNDEVRVVIDTIEIHEAAPQAVESQPAREPAAHRGFEAYSSLRSYRTGYRG